MALGLRHLALDIDHRNLQNEGIWTVRHVYWFAVCSQGIL